GLRSQVVHRHSRASVRRRVLASPAGAGYRATAMGTPPPKHLHLVSDATGDTILSVARACLAQFDEIAPVEHFWNLVRTQRQLDLVIADIHAHPGLVLFTLVDQPLRLRLVDACREAGVPAISVLDPVLGALGPFLGRSERF